MTTFSQKEKRGALSRTPLFLFVTSFKLRLLRVPFPIETTKETA
jgi:hypothetical protein